MLLGKQSIDGDNGQTGPMLAGLLDWGEASCISSFQMEKDAITVEEETETGKRTLLIPLPAVLSTDLRLNKPRYPKLPDLVKAKKKPMKVIPIDTVIDAEKRVQ